MSDLLSQSTTPHQVSETKSSSEGIYFCGLSLYILLYMQYETRWDYGEMISWMMEMLAMLCLIVHAALTFPHFEKAKEKLIFVVTLLISGVVGLNAGHIKGGNYLYIVSIAFLLVFGARNIDFRKILKVYLYIGGVYCAVTVCASLMGIIENLSDTQDRDEAIGVIDDADRFCLGYGWSTNMANHVFFVLLIYFYYVGRTLKLKELLAFFLITMFVYSYTISRLSTACVFLMILFSLFYRTNFGKRFLEGKVVSIFLIVSIPFFALLSFYATAAYDESDLLWFGADILLSGRLRIGQEALDTAGISIWGQFYEMFSSARSDGNSYNYIDCSYIQLCVIYGLVYTALLICAYTVICRNAYRRRDFILMYSVFFAGISGMIAQHFIEMYMNPFLIALFANHDGIGISQMKPEVQIVE